jgi:SAM-dependent methyltransferase
MSRIMWKSTLRKGLLRALGATTGRHPLLLPAAAGTADRLLAARAPYRVEGKELTVELLDEGTGSLSAELLGYEGKTPSRSLWRAADLRYAGPSRLTLDLASGAVTLDGGAPAAPLSAHPMGTVPLPLPRRFCWRLELRSPGNPAGGVRSRLTGHYLARPAETPVDGAYFGGETYFDYAAESADEASEVVRRLRGQGAAGPVLEIGCATGATLAALGAAGFAPVGVDLSAWAVERATERLGAGHAWVCDVEQEALPAAVAARAPFGAIVLWAVLEHFRQPFAVLERLGRLAAPGCVLLINTTNQASLTHRLFGSDWEGYFDWTHLGVEQLDAAALRRELPRLGWRVESLSTYMIWTVCADSTHASLREWAAADARFRQLLTERNLGDMAVVVATRGTPAP